MKNTLSLVILSLIVLVTSCTKGPKQTEYIPKQTASVITINYKAMTEKSQIQGKKTVTKLLSYFNNYGFSNETFDVAVTSFFSDSTTGIDTSSPIMAYLIPSQEFKNAYKCMSVMLQDSATFSTYLQTILSERYEKITDVANCVCYMNTNDRISWIAYNNEVAILGCATMHTKGIKECINSIFSQKHTLRNNSDFVASLQEKGDLKIWYSTTNMIDCYHLWYSELPSFITAQNLSESILKDNYIHANINFNKNVEINLDCNPGHAFKKYWKKYNFTSKDFDSKICNVLPQNTMWFASLAVNPDKFVSAIENSEEYEYAKKELAKLNLTVEDLAASFTGNMAFSLYDVTLEKVRAMEFTQSPTNKTLLWKHLQKEQKVTFPHFVFALELKDAKTPNTVLNHISSEVCEQLAPGLFDFSKIMGFPAFVVCKETMFLFTSDKTFAQSKISDEVEFLPVLSSLQGKSMKELEKCTKNCASYHYMDFSVKNYPPSMKNYLKEMDVLPLVEQYSSIVKSAEMTLTDSYKGSISVEFQDTTENSLTQINKLLDIIIP